MVTDVVCGFLILILLTTIYLIDRYFHNYAELLIEEKQFISLTIILIFFIYIFNKFTNVLLN